MQRREKSTNARRVRQKMRKTQVKRGRKNPICFYMGIMLCVLLLPILCVNVTILLKGILLPNEVPKIFGIVPMVVTTDSMNVDRTSIAGGDMIFAKEIEARHLREGEIILFKQGHSMVLHRIAKVDETGEVRKFVTKGDANNAIDTELVLEEDVVGIYKMRIPNLGRFVLFMRTGAGIMLCVGGPLILFLVYELIQKNRRTRIMEREMQELRKSEDNHAVAGKKAREHKTDMGNRKKAREHKTDMGNRRKVREYKTDMGNRKKVREHETDMGNRKRIREHEKEIQ